MNGSFTEIKQAHLKPPHRSDLNGHRAVFPDRLRDLSGCSGPARLGPSNS